MDAYIIQQHFYDTLAKSTSNISANIIKRKKFRPDELNYFEKIKNKHADYS